MNIETPIVLVDKWGSAFMIDPEINQLLQIPISDKGIMLFDEAGIVDLDFGVSEKERDTFKEILFDLLYEKKLRENKNKLRSPDLLWVDLGFSLIIDIWSFFYFIIWDSQSHFYFLTLSAIFNRIFFFKHYWTFSIPWYSTPI